MEATIESKPRAMDEQKLRRIARDLRKTPPRSPRQKLGGFVIAANAREFHKRSFGLTSLTVKLSATLVKPDGSAREDSIQSFWRR
jgi:hypothetical protein